MSIVTVRAAQDSRAFETPDGPEIDGVDFRSVRDTPFVRRQIEVGDLEVKGADKPAKDDKPAADPAKTNPSPEPAPVLADPKKG